MQKTRVLSTALALAAVTAVGACHKDTDDKPDTVAVPAATATSGGDISTQTAMPAPMDSTHAGMATGAATTTPIDSAKTAKPAKTKKP